MRIYLFILFTIFLSSCSLENKPNIVNKESVTWSNNFNNINVIHKAVWTGEDVWWGWVSLGW